MVISHNMLAMNADRQLGIVGVEVQKSTEKLSSGYRINRGVDDDGAVFESADSAAGRAVHAGTGESDNTGSCFLARLV